VFASLSVPPNMSFGRSVPDLFGGAVPDARRRCIQAPVPGLRPQPCQDVQGRGLQVGDAGLRERDHERSRLVSADRRDAGLQLCVVRLHGDHAGDIMLQVPARLRAQEVLGGQSAGE